MRWAVRRIGALSDHRGGELAVCILNLFIGAERHWCFPKVGSRLLHLLRSAGTTGGLHGTRAGRRSLGWDARRIALNGLASDL